MYRREESFSPNFRRGLHWLEVVLAAQQTPFRRMMNSDRLGLSWQPLIALNEAQVGQTGVVERIDLDDDTSHHIAHLGFLPGADVEVLRRAPAGDPTVYRIDGIEVALRNETSRHIVVKLNEVAGRQPR